MLQSKALGSLWQMPLKAIQTFELALKAQGAVTKNAAKVNSTVRIPDQRVELKVL